MEKFRIMKNTSVSLGNYFDQFVVGQVSVGRYKNVSEVPPVPIIEPITRIAPIENLTRIGEVGAKLYIRVSCPKIS